MKRIGIAFGLVLIGALMSNLAFAGSGETTGGAPPNGSFQQPSAPGVKLSGEVVVGCDVNTGASQVIVRLRRNNVVVAIYHSMTLNCSDVAADQQAILTKFTPDIQTDFNLQGTTILTKFIGDFAVVLPGGENGSVQWALADITLAAQ